MTLVVRRWSLKCGRVLDQGSRRATHLLRLPHRAPAISGGVGLNHLFRSLIRSPSEYYAPQQNRRALSALGQKQTLEHVRVMSALPPKADIASYSTTSSARAINDCGTFMPSALAVLRLTTVSYFVGACTGSSDGFSPLSIRTT